MTNTQLYFEKHMKANLELKTSENEKLTIPYDPLKALNYAYEESKKVKGSSTACIVSLLNNKMYSVNLGDSGFYLLRQPEVFVIFLMKYTFIYIKCNLFNYRY